MMPIQIENKIWIESKGKAFLGQGRISLLESIRDTGSISKAALNLNMSYRKAWKLVQSMNEGSKKPLIKKSIGGKNGGGSILTEFGESIIIEFRRIEEKSKKYLQKELSKSKLNQKYYE
jgi:molybdate transport system regulatory protein